MHTYPEAIKLNEHIKSGKKVVILQADNPDADSLGSALALETILGDLGLEPYLYCGVEIPSYLSYLSGWDRVERELPNTFDFSIIVDASTSTLFEKLLGSRQKTWLSTKPCIVLDHHETVQFPIEFATLSIVDHHRASTGELIHLLAQQLSWPESVIAQEYLMTSILGDTQGLTNQLTSAETYRAMADFVESGVDRPKLEEARREAGKMPQIIYGYKADLIRHTTFSADGSVAHVAVPQSEINTYSPLYNPGPLVQNDMLQVQGVRVAIVFKHYDDHKITAAIRCNTGFGIAAELAEHYGGGGHAYASGFKITGGRDFQQLREEAVAYAEQLIANIKKA